MVVSDHGFAPLSHRVNLWTPFIEAGLVSVNADARTHGWSVASWKAQPWIAGGMAAIMLQQPGDAGTLHVVVTCCSDLRAMSAMAWPPSSRVMRCGAAAAFPARPSWW